MRCVVIKYVASPPSTKPSNLEKSRFGGFGVFRDIYHEYLEQCY